MSSGMCISSWVCFQGSYLMPTVSNMMELKADCGGEECDNWMNVLKNYKLERTCTNILKKNLPWSRSDIFFSMTVFSLKRVSIKI